MRNILTAIFIVFIASVGHSELRTVEIGIASNFSEISSSSSNPYGNYFRQGIELAIKHQKAALEKRNLTIKLTEFDYGTSQMRVVDVAERACKSNVALVLGYVYSSDALLAAPIHQKCKLPLFSPSATANRLSDFDSYVHLGAYSNRFQGSVLAQIAKDSIKARRALVVFAEDCAYCTDLASAFETEFKRGRGFSIEKLSVLSTDTDYTALAEKTKKLNPDVILVPNHELLSSRIILSLTNAGIKKPFLGGDGWGNHGEQFAKILGGKPIEGFSVSHWFHSIPTERSKHFISEYQKHFKKMPNDTAVLSYDSMSLIIEALLKANDPGRESLELALRSIKRFEGVTGKFDYSEGRAPKKDIVLLRAGTNDYKFMKIVRSDRR